MKPCICERNVSVPVRVWAYPNESFGWMWGSLLGSSVVGTGFHQAPFKDIWSLKYCVFYFFEHKNVFKKDTPYSCFARLPRAFFLWHEEAAERGWHRGVPAGGVLEGRRSHGVRRGDSTSLGSLSCCLSGLRWPSWPSSVATVPRFTRGAPHFTAWAGGVGDEVEPKFTPHSALSRA